MNDLDKEYNVYETQENGTIYVIISTGKIPASPRYFGYMPLRSIIKYLQLQQQADLKSTLRVNTILSDLDHNEILQELLYENG